MDIKPQPKQAQAWMKLLDKTTKYVVFGGAAGGGKRISLSTNVLTNKGWKLASEVTYDDKLVSQDGTYTNIIGIYPHKDLPTYRITFSDGRWVDCDGEHLWKVYSKTHGARDGWRIKTTNQLLKYKDGWSIPLCESVPGEKWDGPDPYTLGYILGDGTLTGHYTTIYTVDQQTIDFLKESGWACYDYESQNTIMCQFFKEDFRNVLSKISGVNKFVPNELLMADRDTRLAVLQGLMDSDGCAESGSKGGINFTNKSKQLCEDVIYLTRSLGGWATLHEINRGERKVKQWISDGHYYKVNIRTCGKFIPFRLERKIKKVKPFRGNDKLGIKSIIEIENTDGVCFAVDHESHLFIIKDFVVTHNTWLGCEWILSMCLTYPGSKWFIARSELKRIMMSVIPSMRKVCNEHGLNFDDVMKINGQYNYIEFTNGSRVDLLDVKATPTDPLFERFGSLEFSGGWIEEAGEIDSQAFEILKSRIGRHMSDKIKPKVLITCNPKKNWLYYDFYLPNKEGRLPPDHAFIEAKFSDNEYTREIYGEQLAGLKDKIMRQRLEFGEWEYDDDGSGLLTFDEVLSVFVGEGEKNGNKYMTIDPAFLGKDEAVIMIWDGYVVTKVVNIPKTDHSSLMQLIDLYARQENIPKRNIVADAVGEGAYLPAMLPGIRAFLGGSSPLQDKNAKYDELKRAFFANLRTQCIYEMSHLIKIGKVKIENTREEVKKKVIAELQLWKVEEMNDEKKLKIIGKSEMKDALGSRSTDYTDALYMRAFFDLNGDKSGMTSEVARKQMQMIENRTFNRWGV